MVTTKQKDEILQILYQNEGKGTFDGEVIGKNVGVEPRHVVLVVQDLERRGYLTYLGMARYYFQVTFTLDGYDFQKNGGFASVEAASNNSFASNLFQSTKFGDNATIIVGSHNVQTVTNTLIVKQGDFNSLRKALKTQKVADADISELELVIDSDDTDFRRQTFGSKVNEWIKKMVAKAVNSSWEISIGIAGSFLYEVIKYYYGWHI